MKESNVPREMIKALIDNGRLEEALAFCQDIIEKEGNNLDILQIHAFLLKDLNRIDEAIDAYRLLIQLQRMGGDYLKAVSSTKLLSEFAPEVADELTLQLAENYQEEYGGVEQQTMPSLPPFVLPEEAKNNPVIQEIVQEFESNHNDDDDPHDNSS